MSYRLKGKKSTELFNRYAGALKQTLHADDLVWQVFFYLFEEKVYERRPTHSAYDICKSLKISQQTNAPLNGGKNPNDKNVSEAIEALVSIGYVIKRKNKTQKKRSIAGRPAAYVYELESIATIIAKIKEQFQNKMQNAMDIFQPLQDMEEAAVNKIDESG